RDRAASRSRRARARPAQPTRDRGVTSLLREREERGAHVLIGVAPGDVARRLGNGLVAGGVVEVAFDVELVVGAEPDRLLEPAGRLPAEVPLGDLEETGV